MRLFNIILLFFVLSCQNSQSNNEEFQIPKNEKIKFTKESVKDSIPEEIADAQDFDEFCTEGGIPKLLDFFSSYLSSDGVKQIREALFFYSNIETDTAMADFYLNYLPKVCNTINKAFYKFREKYDEEDDWQFVEDWNAHIGECIPFMIFIIDNHFDGAEGYQYTSGLLEKGELTKGKADDTFFEAEINCWGMYPAAYSSLHSEQIACDITTSTYGGGLHYEALKSVAKADACSKLFKIELDKFAEFILSEEKGITFGYSKENVYKEIEQILSLRRSTNYDFSKVEKLKLFLDTTSIKLYFNCLDGSCPP